MLYIFIILTIVVVSIYFKTKNENKKFLEKENLLKSIDDFTVSDNYISDKGFSIGLDKERNSICFVDNYGNSNVYKYTEIIECSIEIDGEIVQKKSTTNTALRTLAGGLLLGGTGAIVGGLSGSYKNKEKIKSVILKIIVNDIENPVFKIDFLFIECNKESIIYTAAKSNVEKWHGIVSILINKNE